MGLFFFLLFKIANIVTFLAYFRTTINLDELKLKSLYCQFIGRITILRPALVLSLSRNVGGEGDAVCQTEDRNWTIESFEPLSLQCSK